MVAQYNYNTFIVQDCKSGAVLLVTSSARKARDMFGKGKRIEVWSCNKRVERITTKTRERNPMQPYVELERDYIRTKQEKHTRRRWVNVKTANRDRPNNI